MATPETVPYADQIAAVERELGYRRRVYADRVQAGKMTQALADRELSRMTAVRQTLERIAGISANLRDAELEVDALSILVSLVVGPHEEIGAGVGIKLEALGESIRAHLEALHQPAPAGEQRELL